MTFTLYMLCFEITIENKCFNVLKMYITVFPRYIF